MIPDTSNTDTPAAARDTIPEPAAPVLLYDGLCGFCDATVRFVLARDREGIIRFAPLQGTFAGEVMRRHPELTGIDSIALVEQNAASGGEDVSVRTEAALRIARHLGGGWRLAAILRVIPRPVRDLAYDIFARFRYRMFGRYDSCPLPSADVRSRFLE